MSEEAVQAYSILLVEKKNASVWLQHGQIVFLCPEEQTNIDFI